jgi:hypothetical protein
VSLIRARTVENMDAIGAHRLACNADSDASAQYVDNGEIRGVSPGVPDTSVGQSDRVA